MTHLFTAILAQVDASGNPYAGATLEFDDTTTTNKITVYQDSGKITPHTNPVTADSSGLFAPIYVDTATYKVVHKTSAAVVIETIDPVYATIGTAQTAFASGSVSAPSITFTGDLNTGFWRVGADEIGISVGGLKFVDITTSVLAINTTLTAPQTPSLTEALQIVSNAKTGITLDTSVAGVFPSSLTFRKSLGTQAAKTAVGASNRLGEISFIGADGSSYYSAANGYIRGRVPSSEANWTGSTHATEIAFGTTPTGSVTASNEFILTSDGYINFPVQALTVTNGSVTNHSGALVTGTGPFLYAAGIAGPTAYSAVDVEQFVLAVSANALSNSSTSAQAIFDAANDTLTVAASTTYFFEAIIYLGTGATSHTTAFGFGGTATFTSVLYFSELVSAAATTVSTTGSFLEVVSSAATVLNAASTAVVTKIALKGTIRINGGGTIIPQVTFSAGPTGTCQTNINSYFRAWPVGSNTVAAVGGWA